MPPPANVVAPTGQVVVCEKSPDGTMLVTGCPAESICPTTTAFFDAIPSRGARIFVYETSSAAKSRAACAVCTPACAEAAFARACAICASTALAWPTRACASCTCAFACAV